MAYQADSKLGARPNLIYLHEDVEKNQNKWKTKNPISCPVCRIRSVHIIMVCSLLVYTCVTIKMFHYVRSLK